VQFPLVHAGKYRTEDKLKIQTMHKLNNPEKANNAKNSKTKLPWFSRFFRHFRHSAIKRKGGLILQRSRVHTRPCGTGRRQWIQEEGYASLRPSQLYCPEKTRERTTHLHRLLIRLCAVITAIRTGTETVVGISRESRGNCCIIQESPAIADKPARRESLPKIAPIRRAYNVVANNTGLSSFI